MAQALGELRGWLLLRSFIRRMISCRLWVNVQRPLEGTGGNGPAGRRPGGSNEVECDSVALIYGNKHLALEILAHERRLKCRTKSKSSNPAKRPAYFGHSRSPRVRLEREANHAASPSKGLGFWLARLSQVLTTLPIKAATVKDFSFDPAHFNR